MGHRGEYFHPEVVEAMGRVVEACKYSGVAPGIAFATGVDHVNSLVRGGFRFIGVGSDTGFLATGCKETLAKIKR